MLPLKQRSCSESIIRQLLKLSSFIPSPRKRWSCLYRLLPAYEWNGLPLKGFIKSDQYPANRSRELISRAAKMNWKDIDYIHWHSSEWSGLTNFAPFSVSWSHFGPFVHFEYFNSIKVRGDDFVATSGAGKISCRFSLNNCGHSRLWSPSLSSALPSKATRSFSKRSA